MTLASLDVALSARSEPAYSHGRVWHMNEVGSVMEAALAIAEAIARRDVKAVAGLLAPGFVHHTPGGETRDADTFTRGIAQIPGEIAFVRLGNVRVDLAADAALVSGIQHARVRVEGQDIDDRRAFVDWFLREPAGWKLKVAVDLPAPHKEPNVDGG
jgi:ketosteroid isomerase-like protein